MCGFVGFLSPQWQLDEPGLTRTLQQANDQITHRGPDAEGLWVDPKFGIGLGHRRLSIIDLSPTGAQPMLSDGGRYVIAYNGEVYNFKELRAELEKGGATFKGHSDTEVLLAGIIAWGVEETLRRANGMFAIAVWDQVEKELWLARDRLGQKPLYYGWLGDNLVFGSELASLATYPGFTGEVDRNVLPLFLRYGAVPGHYSIYHDIYKLLPGSFVRFRYEDLAGQRAQFDAESSPKPFWSMVDVALSGMASPYSGSYREAVTELEGLLTDAVDICTIADVPLGAFLSGGVDSSLICALMQKVNSTPIRTFSIGFDDPQFNEAQHAAEVAKHLGTDHTELYVSRQDVLDVVPTLGKLYSEPFADASQIPTFLVSKMARQHVTVCLSGDAGDELFGGYNRYFWGNRINRFYQRVPQALRGAMGAGMRGVPVGAWDSLGRFAHAVMPQKFKMQMVGDKVHKLSGILSAPDGAEMYRRLTAIWRDPSQAVAGGHEAPLVVNEPHRWPQADDLAHRMMLLDSIGYLPDDILVKVDRAAMGVSLETRIPLLDHRVVEFAWRMPLSWKMRDGKGKLMLRDVLYRHVPQELIERPKQGFGVPLADWLRGEVKDWAADLLDPAKLRNQGYFNEAVITETWNHHQSGKRNFHYQLWNVLMFQAWLAEQGQ